MKKSFPVVASLVIVVSSLFNGMVALSADAPEKEPLALALPDPTLKGTPDNPPTAPGVDPILEKPPAFMVPKGVKNLALHKTVTSSVPPFTGTLAQITDGKKQPIEEDCVEFKKGAQWVQVDLGASYPLYAIAFWHDHRIIQVVKCSIIEVSDDPEFKANVTVLFNNDKENLAGQGAGTDNEYFETRQGRVIDAKGVKARYIRGYTKGNSQTSLNCWQEIEAYGLPDGK